MTQDTWLTPDISVRWPDQPIRNDYLQGAPLIAVEIVSRGNTADEIDRKTAVYLDQGAAEVWIVYPRTRCMMVHRKNSVEKITDTYNGPYVPVTVRLADIFPAVAH
jgi:Uma2 family endonuclease